ncbi:MAG: AAA family ATPase [Clostridia bacterium]|nr:AAA family ATPase [Clostridia bacterium]
MKIKSVNIISYGKFNNRQIDFKDGLNIVYGGNEAGKSTLMSFIKSMLFGFNAPKVSDVKRNDRLKYTPWDGKILSGEMDIVSDGGKTLRISRKSGRTRAYDALECFDILNSENYDFVPENEVGIGEDAFLKTFYIKQLGTKISGENEELAQKLINLTHNASEDVSLKEASERIREQMKRLMPERGKGGLINELGQRITELNNELVNAQKERDENAQNIEKEKSLSAYAEKLRSDIERLTKEKETAVIQEKYDSLKTAQKDKADAESALEYVENELKCSEEYLKKNAVYQEQASEIIHASKENTENIESDIKRLKNKCPLISFACSAAVEAAICLMLYYITKSLKASFNSFGCLALITAAVFCFFEYKRKKLLKVYEEKLCTANEKNAKIDSELFKYGVSTADEYNKRMVNYIENKLSYAALTEKAVDINKKIGDITSLINGIKIPEDFVPVEVSLPIDIISEMIEEKRKALETAVAEHAKIEGVLSAAQGGTRTPDLIVTERADILSQLEEANAEYEALSLAFQCMNEAYAQINSDYTPVINNKAAEILSRITGGKYNKLYLDKEYSVKLLYEGTKDLGYFSSGTCDAVYFCVRLAVADTLFGQTKPIFIDDGFAQYDKGREDNAFSELLHRAKNGQQIIMFTCRKPEINKDDVNIINL